MDEKNIVDRLQKVLSEFDEPIKIFIYSEYKGLDGWTIKNDAFCKTQK
ncbi:unnamed protein product [marine sediment metagenome]|uniref:Uncharacterized protein n=1 Tax=marine sediment metagenome TaxID=412755 RepID=X1JBZ7_9ZZZZ